MNRMLWLVFLALFGQVMEPTGEARLRKQIPKTYDREINAIAADPSTQLYTRQEIPLVYFHEGTYHDGNFDIGPDEAPRPHNGSREFPWNVPGGTQRCGPEVKNFKFLYLPPGKKIVFWQAGLAVPRGMSYGQIVSHERASGYAWQFPEGAVFGEVLTLYDRPFEFRVRKKVAGNDWNVDLFRPFRTADELVRVLPPDNPVAHHLRSPGSNRRQRLADDGHPHRRALEVTACTDSLPAFASDIQDRDKIVDALLARPFHSCLGVEWRPGCNCPTTEASFSIVPRHYDGNFVGNDAASCMKCHESASQHVSNFHFGRDWYGFIRGSDKILSWHPIDPSCLVRDASSGPVVLRKELVGLLDRR